MLAGRIDHENLAIQVQQGIQTRVASRFVHIQRLSVSDNLCQVREGTGSEIQERPEGGKRRAGKTANRGVGELIRQIAKCRAENGP